MTLKPRVALLSSEPIRLRMGGIGIRYLELARRLQGHGLQVVLLSPSKPEDVKDVPLAGVELRSFQVGKLADLLVDCGCAVAQGQLANDVILEVPGLPVVIDLYDPFMIENFAYLESLGLDAYRNDHTTWVLQMSRGDFFLCSSEEQRHFYLGFLAALGRVNPVRVVNDPELRSLVTPVPFGVPDKLPPYQPLLPARPPGETWLLFGGLYDWYDPFTLLEAMKILDRPDWIVFFIRNPNPESTPQVLLQKVEARCRQLGWWEERVRLIDWTAADRRYDMLREMDLMVAPHKPTLETTLSLRTRCLDALAAGCPVITSEGGAMSRLMREYNAGWVAAPGDAAALARQITEAVEDKAERERRMAGADRLLETFRWDRVLLPLVEFCRNPKEDPTKEQFAHRPAVLPPVDPFLFRLRRKVRTLRNAVGLRR